MNFAAALGFLERRQETRWKLGLSRIEGLLGALGRPHDGLRCVHVAGTNGKGSFAAILAAIFQAAGLRTGLFTSPHLSSPRERIKVDGEMIPEGDFARLMTKARAAEPEETSYFELMSAVGFLYFRERGVDAAVVEVGLGGRLDATNVIEKPLLTVITSIALDHTKHLGDTLGAIAGEKAGILKPGAPCLCGETKAEPLGVIERRAEEIGVRLIHRSPEFRVVSTDWESGCQRVEISGKERTVSLLGRPAARSAALAVEAVSLLPNLRIREDAIDRGLVRTVWPARFEVLRREGRTIILDGAHNPEAMAAFAETWQSSPWRGEDSRFVVGVLKDKDYRSMLKRLVGCGRRFVATQPNSPRALPANELAAAIREAAPGASVEVEVDPKRALLLGDEKVKAVVGSLYLIGEVLSELGRTPQGVR